VHELLRAGLPGRVEVGIVAVRVDVRMADQDGGGNWVNPLRLIPTYVT
jgi:hypothetical protein